MPMKRLQLWGHRNNDVGERLNGIQEVSGSIPLISTKKRDIRKDVPFLGGDNFLFCLKRSFPSQRPPAGTQALSPRDRR